VRHLGESIAAIHFAEGDWASATAATVASQRWLAAMSGEDPLPAIARALRELHARALNYAPPGVAEDLGREHTEVLRVLAGRDPARFASAYGEQLLISMRSRPSATGVAREALDLARGIDDAFLRVRIPLEVAGRMLPERPAEALSMLDLPEGPSTPADEAETHRLRAECLRLLGREDERADAMQREAQLKLGYAGSAFPHQRLLVIEDVLWDAGRTDAARSLLDKAIETIAEDRDAAGLLRIRRAERAPDPEALEELAIVAERYPRLAARCQTAYALAHWRAQRRDEAIAACDESLQINAGQHHAHHLRGAFRARLGSIRASLEDLEAAARIEPDYWATRAELSETYLLLHLADDAVREGRLAVDLDPDEGSAHAAYGLALLAAGHRPEAFAELDASLALRSTMYPLDLPRLLVARGEVDAALEAMREAVALSPTPYLVRDTASQLRQMAVALPETAGGCAKVLEVLTADG
jgi:tetratricopeptide (TPR) repeat protein